MKQIIQSLNKTESILELIESSDREISKTNFWLEARRNLSFAIKLLEEIERADPRVISRALEVILDEFPGKEDNAGTTPYLQS